MKAGPPLARHAGASRRRLHLKSLAGLSALTMLAAVVMPTAASAATCAAGELVPQVRGHSISQGLRSYKDLVRGKDIFFRLFLSRPACAEGTTQAVSLTGATLAVKAGATTLLTVAAPTNNLNPPPLLAYHSQAPAVPDSTGDPKWLVNGTELAAAAPAAATPLTFEATLRYSNTAGASNLTFPVTTVNGQTMQKTLLGATLPLRVLAIPMGRATQTVASQFGADARAATIDGFSHLGRMFPVANGTADLTTSGADLTTGGARYHLNTNTMVDVSRYMSSGVFCDDGSALKEHIAPQLLDNLKQYNTANPLSKSADNVMGVVDQAISSNNCAEGWALINSKVAYARARYGTSPPTTGATMAMETGHNLGGVPCGATTASTTTLQCPVDRDRVTDAYHAQTTWARSTASAAYPDLAYNLLSPTAVGQPVTDDKNVMRFSGQPAGSWTNATTFLQAEDWALFVCKLGGPSTNDCVLPVNPSAAAGAAAQPTTTIVGTTDGTRGGTEVFDSFADQPGAVDLARESHIHLVQRNAANAVVQNEPVLLTDHGGEGHHSGPAGHDDSKVFSVSYATHPDAAVLELVNTNTGEVLYRRTKTGGGPRNVHTSVTMTGGGTGGGCTADCPPPSEMAGPSGFGGEARRIDFETNPQTGEAYEAGDTVTTQYLLSHGLSFNDDTTTTPKIVGDCASLDTPCRFPAGTTTQSGRFSLWNSPDTLPAEGPVDPVPNSAGVPLRVNFVQPVQRVALHAGNDDTSNTTATLTAFDAAGEEITTVTRSNFGSSSTTFMGIDAGRADVAGIELDYGQSPLGEEIDDLILERPAGVTPTNTYRAVVTAEDDDPSNMRAAFFAKCPSSNEILVGGVPPVAVTGNQATFHYDFDATQICRNGSTTTILVRFNDGYNQTSFYEINVNAASGTEVRAVIDNPAAEASAYSVLQHEPITLSGQGWDSQEGLLPGSSLRWRVTGPAGVVADGVTGNDVVLPAPAAGWTPGSYIATLKVTNSAGSSAETTSTFRVLEDKDNDGIDLSSEECFRGSDNDPNDAFGDFDGDGVPNQQDESRCSPRTTYEGFADFDPNTLNYPSQGGSASVTVKVNLRYRDLRQVNGSTVRITSLAGADVPSSPAFRATAWNVSTAGGQVQATAKFDRQAIIDFLCPSPSRCHTNQTVSIALFGEAPRSGASPAYTFTASDSFNVQKS